MAKIEERIVSMKFDNKQFKMAAAETMHTLEALKSKLKFDRVGKIFGGADKEIKAMSRSVETVDFSHMSRQLDQIQKQWSVMGTVSRSAIDAMTKGVLGLATKGFQSAWGTVVSGGMNRARNLEQANFMLNGILKDSANAAAETKAIMDDANYAVTDTAFGLDSAAKAAAQFAANGMRGGEEMRTTLRSISGVASMTSSSYDEIAGIFTTVAGQGKLMSYQLNQLAFRGLNAASVLSKHFKVTEAELRDMVSKGKVSFEDFATAMDGAFGDQAKESNKTFEGALSNMKAALGRIGAKFATPYMERMRDLFNAIRPAINAVNTALDPFINTLNKGFNQSVSTAIGYISKFTSALEAYNDPTKANPAGGWTKFFDFFNDLAIVFDLVRSVGADMLKVLMGAAPSSIAMTKAFGSTGEKLQHIFRKLLSFFMLVPEFIGAILKEVFNLGDGFGSVGGSILDVIDNLAGFLYLFAEFVRGTGIIKGVAKVFGFLARIIVSVVGVLVKFVSLITKGFVGLAGFLSPLLNVFKSIGKAVSNLFGQFKKFKLPKFKFDPFENLGKSVQNVVSWIKELWSSIRGMDFGTIGEFFKNIFKMGSPDFSGVRDFASTSRDMLSSGFSNINIGGVKNTFGKIGGYFSDAFKFVRSVDYAAIGSSIVNGIKNAFTWTGGKLLDFGKWISESLSGIDWGSVGDNISNGIIKAVTGVAAATGAVAKFFHDFFSDIIESIDWDAVWGSFKDGFENLKGAWSEITDAFSGKDFDTNFLENALGQVNADATLTVATDIGKQTQKVGDKLRGFWDVLFGRKSDVIGAHPVAEDIERVGNEVRTATATLSNPFGTARANVKGFFTDLGDTIRTSSEQMVEGVNIADLLNSIGIVSGGLGVFKMGEAAKDIAALPKAFAGVLGGIKEAITSMGEAAKIEARGNTILKVAIALAVFAGAAYFLSRVPWDQLKVGLGATIALLGALIGAMLVLDKFMSEESGDKLKNLAKAMVLIGLAVALLAGSLYLMSKLDTADIMRGLLAIGGMILALAGGVALAGLAGSISGLGGAFLGLALGVGILAASLLVFKMVSLEDIGKGLLTLAGALLAISVAARIADGKKLAGAGLGMLGLGAGLFALAFGIKAIADIDTDALLKGLGVLGGVMLAMGLLGRYGGSITVSIGALIGVAGAILAMAYAVEYLSGMSFGQIVSGMAGIAIGIGLLGLALRAFPKTMPAIAGSLMGIAGAIGILVAAIWVIGNMDLTTVIQGMVALGLALAGFVIALNFIPAGAMGKIGAISLGMMMLAGTLVAFSFAIKTFEGIDWNTMGKAGAVIGVLAAAIGLISWLGVPMATGITAFGLALMVLGGGLGVIAAAAWLFADAVSKIIDSITGLADQGGKIKDALREAGEGVTEFANGADEGLRNLFATFDEAGAIDVGKIALLFKTLSDIPPDMDVRMDSMVKGLEKIQGVMPVIRELNDFGKQVGFGDNRSIGGFFKALANIDPAAGDNLSNVVQGLRDIEPVIGIMEKLSDVGAGIDEGFLGFIGGDNNALSGFFKALGDIDPSIGDNIGGFVSGINELDKAIEPLSRIQLFSRNIDEGALGFIGGDNNALSGFFKTFEKINPDVGTNISAFVSGIKTLDDNMEAIQRIHRFSTGVDDGFLGMGGDTGALTGFFKIFDSIDPSAGANISAFASGITALDGVFEAIQRITALSSFIKVEDNNKLSSFFNSLSGSVSAEMGSNLSAASSGMQELSDVIPTLQTAVGQLESIDLDSFGANMSNIGDAMNSGVVDGISNAASAISDAVTSMVSAVTDKSSEFNTAGTQLATAIGEGIQSREGELRIRVSTVVTNASSGVEATARSAFRSVGAAITDGMAAGITAGPIIAKAREVALSAKAAAEAALQIKSPSRVFRQIGKYVVDGFAQGMDNDGASKGAARDMAKGVIETSKDEFDIHSPSRVYRDIGMNINQGLAGGLYDFAYMPIDALNDTFKAMGLVVKEGMSNIDKIVYMAAAVNPFTSYLEGVSREARKTRKDQLEQRRKDAKEENKRLDDQLYDAEKALLDYEDSILDAEDSIADAKKSIADSKKEDKKDTKDTKKAAKDVKKDARDLAKADRDLAKKKRDLEASRRERADKLEAVEKAKQERAWYDANVQGYLAGKAFAEGTESGLKDADEKLKTENELFVELLSDKVKDTKDHIANVRDAIGSLKEIGSIFKNTTTAVRDFERAFKRLNSSTSDRAAQRNMGIMLDSVLAIGDELVKVIELYDRFEPFMVDVLNRMDKMLPTVLPMITQFAPAIGAQLSQGLLVALPQIIGASGGIIAAIAGIGLFLYDMGKDQKIFKFIKNMLNNILTFIVKLPSKLVGILTTMIKGIVNLIKEIPKYLPELIQAIIDGIVVMIEELPNLIASVLEGIVEVLITLLSSPAWIAEMVVTIVRALLEAIPRIAKALVGGFFQLGKSLIDSLVDGIFGGLKAAVNGIIGAISNVFGGIFSFFMPNKKKSGGSLPFPTPSSSSSSGFMPVAEFDPSIFQSTKKPSAYKVDTSKSADVAESLAAERRGSSSLSSRSVTNINYTQNNTSPQPLTAIEIYRNTEKQLTRIG